MLLHPLQWPGNKTCAAAITFDVDADSLIRCARPDNGHLHLQQVSMGQYGPTVAVPRILDSYRRFGLKQTFFMPAWVMETYPDTVDAILKDGHEIGHHSWQHEDPLNHSDEIEAELFDRSMQTHIRMTGQKPRGYRAPVYSITPAMVERLIDYGFLYDSSMMADDMPYLVNTDTGSVIELPPHWGNDDWPPFAHFAEINYMMPVRGPSAGISPFFEELDAAIEVGGFWMPVLHPFLTGRLARWREMERRLETYLADEGIWFTTLEEVALHARAQDGKLRHVDI